MDVPVHSIRYFCVLARELHFGRAATVLHISTPTLSQQITRLESMIGVKLFERGPRSVVLTEAGQEMLPLAMRVRDDHELLLRWAREQSRPAVEILRIGMIAAGAGTLTTAILTTAMQRLPNARIEMRRLGFFDTNSELLNHDVDVVIGPAPVEPDDRIEADPIYSEPRVLVVPESHRLAGRESISIGDAADETFLTPSGGPKKIVDWWLVDPRPDGSRPRRGLVADDFEGLLELVAAGAGVNIASEAATLHYRRPGIAYTRIRDIDPSVILLCSLRASTNPTVAAFTTIAKELARSLPRRALGQVPVI